jgi:hypothetical protein
MPSCRISQEKRCDQVTQKNKALNRSAIGALVSGVALSWDLFRDL